MSGMTKRGGGVDGGGGGSSGNADDREAFDRSFDFFEAAAQQHDDAFDFLPQWNSHANKPRNKNATDAAAAAVDISFDDLPVLFEIAPPAGASEAVQILEQERRFQHDQQQQQQQQRHDDESVVLFPPDPFLDADVGAVDAEPATTTATTATAVLPTVRVSIQEQVTAQYDDQDGTSLSSNHGASTTVNGTIFVQVPPPININDSAATASSPSSPLPSPPSPSFYVIIRDVMEQIDHFEIISQQTSTESDFVVVEDRSEAFQQQPTTTTITSGAWNHPQPDRFLRVSLPTSTTTTTAPVDIPVAKYTCVSSLRPVPMLVKSRVRESDRYIRVGFKIRANPANVGPLQRVFIVMAVPRQVDGPSVKMSRKGGVWDSMKRTISWTVDPGLMPGEALEVQAQFLSLEIHSLSSNSNNNSHLLEEKKEDLTATMPTTPTTTTTHNAATIMSMTTPLSASSTWQQQQHQPSRLQFPVLVQCDYESHFSSLEIVTTPPSSSMMMMMMQIDSTTMTTTTMPVHIQWTASGRILHRKS